LNQKEAYKKARIASDVYTDWEERLGESWGRWRSIPMCVMIAKRKTTCEYCAVMIEMGEMRTLEPTAHMRCFGERLEMSMSLYKDIEQKLIEQEQENDDIRN